MKGGGAIQNPTEPGESGSCRDCERPTDTAVHISKIYCADDPPGLPGPLGPIAAVAAPPLRALVHGGGLDRSSTCLPTPVWPCPDSCQLGGIVFVLGRPGCGSLDIADRILLRSSQARSQRFYLLLGDERFTNAPILDLFGLPFGF